MHEENSAGLITFRDTGSNRKFLLLKYENGGHWGFPKGHIEDGESPVETARRELREETGLELATIYDLFKEKISYFYRRDDNLYFKKVIFFLGVAADDEVVLSSEHIDYDWLSYRKALNRITYQNSRKLLRKAEKFIEKTDG